MKYIVGYRFSARYRAEVEAESLEDALELADEEYGEADFGEAEDIDGRAVFVEDEDGNRIMDV